MTIVDLAGTLYALERASAPLTARSRFLRLGARVSPVEPIAPLPPPARVSPVPAKLSEVLSEGARAVPVSSLIGAFLESFRQASVELRVRTIGRIRLDLSDNQIAIEALLRGVGPSGEPLVWL